MRQDLDLEAGKTEIKEGTFKLTCTTASTAGLAMYFQDEFEKFLRNN